MTTRTKRILAVLDKAGGRAPISSLVMALPAEEPRLIEHSITNMIHAGYLERQTVTMTTLALTTLGRKRLAHRPLTRTESREKYKALSEQRRAYQ